MKLYNKYYQKSRRFLFPILGISNKSNIQPENTYISFKDIIEIKDNKLICYYKTTPTEGWTKFEKKMLLLNPYYEDTYIGKYNNLYIFNISEYQDDLKYFVKGKYSKISDKLKRLILLHHGNTSPEGLALSKFLYPDKHFDDHALELGVDVDIIRNIGELTTRPDLDKENFQDSFVYTRLSSNFEPQNILNDK